jgi:VIT1/CCC1 family predicted Fe2+/Mn2+ transporter
MGSNNSPLESLAAFAIVFVVGVLFTAGLGAYVAKIKHHLKHAVQSH